MGVGSSSLNVSLIKLNNFIMTPINLSIKHSYATLRLKESTGAMEVWWGRMGQRDASPWLEATLLSSLYLNLGLGQLSCVFLRALIHGFVKFLPTSINSRGLVSTALRLQ